MLVLTRRSRESVVVGEPDGCHGMLKVTVLEISRGRVKLGFEADADVPVHRWEVWQRIGSPGGPRPPRRACSLASPPSSS